MNITQRYERWSGSLILSGRTKFYNFRVFGRWASLVISATVWRAVELGSIPRPPTKYATIEVGSIPTGPTKFFMRG